MSHKRGEIRGTPFATNIDRWRRTKFHDHRLWRRHAQQMIYSPQRSEEFEICIRFGYKETQKLMANPMATTPCPMREAMLLTWARFKQKQTSKEKLKERVERSKQWQIQQNKTKCLGRRLHSLAVLQCRFTEGDGPGASSSCHWRAVFRFIKAIKHKNQGPGVFLDFFALISIFLHC